MSRLKKITIMVGLTFGVLTAFISGACIGASAQQKTFPFKSENEAVSKIPGVESIVNMQNVFREIAKTVQPAVVSIHVESTIQVKNPYKQYFNDPFFQNDPFFKFYFGDQDEDIQKKSEAQGSGIIFSKDGYLFSNHHVVANADRITVILADNRQFEAKVVGVDPDTDIAVLKIETQEDLPYAALGDSSLAQTGDLVIAIGNPFGLAGTFTFGIISAVGRPGMASGFQSLIQSDVAVNPGNSGGPLVNIQGQVIGMNSAIQSQTGGYMGISYAIPINLMKEIAVQLIEKGKVERGYFGVYPTALDDATRKSLGLKPGEGVVVSKVIEDSPAALAKIEVGDIILSINGKPIGDPDMLRLMIGNFPPETKIDLEILREGKKIAIAVVLADRNEMNTVFGEKDKPQKDKEQGAKPTSYNFLGAEFAAPSEKDMKKNGVDFGVVVKSVEKGSFFYGVLRPGEILVGINNTKIKDMNAIKEFGEKNKNKKSFVLQIVSGGMLFYKGVEK
ncbi:MAG: hypothetical protein A2Y33_10865 [Spirochaetes bacterium GWF1_51_8]|nr:MAG: hypothetical protein A2Y33_10865 [Spirochaetes bacterium GWF1_51_8]